MAGKYVNTEKGRRWQNADGTYAYVKPGGGAQFGAEFLEFLAPGTNQRTADLDQKNKPLTKNPPRPTGEPNAYAQHGGGTTYYDTADGRSVYQTPGGQTYDSKSGAQIFIHNKTGETMTYDGAFSKTPGGSDPYVGTNGVNIDGQKIFQGAQVWKVPDSTVDTNGGGGGNRNNSRVIPGSGGKVQKGTDMSRSFNDLLATTNTSGYQPFGSNQLPTTAGSPDSKVTPKTQAILAGIQAGKVTDMSIDGYQAPASSRTDAQNSVLAGIQGGQKTDQGIEGYKKPGSPSRLDAALSDTAGMQSYMSKFSSGDRERAANRAFLDTEGSMEGLRAKEAVNGVVYAGGQHYMSGESGDDQAIAINRGQARDISNGRSTTAGLLETYKSRIIGAQKDTPAEAQDPLSAAGSAVKSGFAAGAQTDFGLNNNQAASQTGVGPVVPTDQIPKDLSGAAGKKYLADLDAGRLFN